MFCCSGTTTAAGVSVLWLRSIVVLPHFSLFLSTLLQSGKWAHKVEAKVNRVILRIDKAVIEHSPGAILTGNWLTSDDEEKRKRIKGLKIEKGNTRGRRSRKEQKVQERKSRGCALLVVSERPILAFKVKL